MLFRRGAQVRQGSAGTSPAQDEFASEALVYVDQLFSTALRLTRSRPDAEDLVQDTYLKAFRAADQFRPGTNLKAWLLTILLNTFRNRVRDAGREPLDVDSDAVERAAPQTPERDPERLLLDATLDVDVKAALDALPEAFREAVWLRDVEDLSYAEIARLLDVPQGTVMSRISRGRRLLHDRLQARADRETAPAALLRRPASNET